MTKKIAIIGGGLAGLASVKACLEEGLLPTAFEKSSAIGGVWSGKENGLAWEGMPTTISQWSCMFSDFPWEPHIQDFPTTSEMTHYLEQYSDAFGLRPHMIFNSAAENVSQLGEKFSVTSNGRTEVFDHVINASGVFTEPKMPDLPYKKLHQGQIIHSAQFRSPHQIDRGQRIVVFGGSQSGYEVAAEIALVSDLPVVHVFSNSSWILAKYLNNSEGDQVPLDIKIYGRKDPSAPKKSMRDIGQLKIDFFKSAFGNPGDVHPSLEVHEDPTKPAFSVVSGKYLDAVNQEKIIPVRGGIGKLKRILKSIPCDTLIMATGYRGSLPYLDQAIKSKIHHDENDQFMPFTLSNTVWAQGVEGMAFVGLQRGPYFASIELQARWAAGVMSGRLPKPSNDELAAGVAAAQTIKDTYPRPQFPYADYVSLCDHLAKKVGCYPDLDPSDPLYNDVTKGFFSPSHFRLTGPHSNREVAEHIIGSRPYIK